MFQYRELECGCVTASTTAERGMPVMFIVRNCQNHPNEQPPSTSSSETHDLVLFLYCTMIGLLIFIALYLIYYQYEIPSVEDVD
jgi:hypothetical protein